MGKTQKKRAMRRHNPVRVPDAHLPHGLVTAAASTSSKKRDAIVPVIEKLASTDQQERIWACAAVSNLIQNDPSTRRLLQGKNIVGLLIARLSDEVEEVVVEAAGALRNLCIDGGFDICAEMFNKGILEPLKSFVPKISAILGQILSGSKDTPEIATRFAYDFAENVITLFWCLSEASNKALIAVNQVKLVPFLMAFLDPISRNKIPISTTTAAAQCLYVLTEENDVAADEIRMNSSYISCLMGIARGDVLKSKLSTKDSVDQQTATVRVVSLRTLVCGMLHNISPLPALLSVSAVDLDRSIILPFLLPLLSLNLSERVSQVQSNLSLQEKETLNKQQPVLKNGAASDHKSSSEIALDRIESELRVAKLALELITSICAELPETTDLEEIEDDEEEEWEDDDEDAMMEDDVELVGAESPAIRDPTEPSSAKSVDLVGTVIPACLSLIQPTLLSYPPAFQSSPHPPTTSALAAVHIAALECLNNVCLSIAQLGISSSLYQSSVPQFNTVWVSVWQMLASLGLPEAGLGSGPEQKRQVWSLSLGLLWAVARIGADEEQKLDLIPEEEKVKVLIDLCEQAGDLEVSVKTIGILERLAMHPNPNFVGVNKIISEFILSFLPNSPGPERNAQSEVIIQAASSIIDIFSDETSPWDINFRQGNYNAILKNSIPGFKKAVKSVDKRKEGGRDLRRRGDEVLENLIAFVKYRKGLKV